MGTVTDLGYGFKPVRIEEFDERLRVIRVERLKRLDQRIVQRAGIAIGTVFMVDADPVAFHSVDGMHYLRAS